MWGGRLAQGTGKGEGHKGKLTPQDHIKKREVYSKNHMHVVPRKADQTGREWAAGEEEVGCYKTSMWELLKWRLKKGLNCPAQR